MRSSSIRSRIMACNKSRFVIRLRGKEKRDLWHAWVELKVTWPFSGISVRTHATPMLTPRQCRKLGWWLIERALEIERKKQKEQTA